MKQEQSVAPVPPVQPVDTISHVPTREERNESLSLPYGPVPPDDGNP